MSAALTGVCQNRPTAVTRIQVRIAPFSFINLPDNKTRIDSAAMLNDYRTIDKKHTVAANVISNQKWMVNVNTEITMIKSGQNNQDQLLTKLIYTTTLN
ncbi:MAG: hypothetical protein H7Y13_13635 [Sphingobacteriaceae bacterium]|nr:hypothetical protein [Sphingobacteriaceae bacterium]